MLLKKKHVFCSNCGFLGWRTELPDGSWKIDKLFECGRHARRSFQAGDFHGEEEDPETGESHKIHCLRLQWTLLPHALSPKMNWVNEVVPEISQVRKKRSRSPSRIGTPVNEKYNALLAPAVVCQLPNERSTAIACNVTTLR